MAQIGINAQSLGKSFSREFYNKYLVRNNFEQVLQSTSDKLKSQSVKNLESVKALLQQRLADLVRVPDLFDLPLPSTLSLLAKTIKNNLEELKEKSSVIDDSTHVMIFFNDPDHLLRDVPRVKQFPFQNNKQKSTLTNDQDSYQSKSNHVHKEQNEEEVETAMGTEKDERNTNKNNNVIHGEGKELKKRDDKVALFQKKEKNIADQMQRRKDMFYTARELYRVISSNRRSDDIQKENEYEDVLHPIKVTETRNNDFKKNDANDFDQLPTMTTKKKNGVSESNSRSESESSILENYATNIIQRNRNHQKEDRQQDAEFNSDSILLESHRKELGGKSSVDLIVEQTQQRMLISVQNERRQEQLQLKKGLREEFKSRITPIELRA